MVTIKETVSANIKQLRESLGYSQATLAKMAEISTGYIGSIETGKKFPSAEILERIARALQVRPYRLLQDEKDMLSVYSPDQYYAIQQSLERKLKETLNQTIAEMSKKNSGHS